MFGLSIALLVFVLDTSLKAALVALAAAALMKVLRLGDSNLRHRVWTGVLAGMLLLPLLTPIVPALRLPLLPSPESLLALSEPSIGDNAAALPETLPEEVITLAEPQAEPSRAALESPLPNFRFDNLQQPSGFDAQFQAPPTGAPGNQPSDLNNEAPIEGPAAATPAPVTSRDATSRRYIAAAVIFSLATTWLIGSAVLTARLALGFWLAARLRRTSLAIDSPEPGWGAVDAGARESADIVVPLTVGFLRPQILLPRAWRTWPAEKLRAVLAHEQMHIERGDCAIALLAEINCCLYWFHPLAWWLKRQLAALAEQACDDAAIAALGDRARYARHLLEVAAAASQHRSRLAPAGLSMARASGVETRILAILDFTRPLSRRLTWAKALLLLALMVPLITIAAALSPSSRPLLPEGASIDDATEVEASNDNTIDDNRDSQGPARQAGPTDDATFIYSSTVVDSTGKPVSGAEVRLLRWHNEPPLDQGPPAAITDSEGKFRFTRRKSDFREGDDLGLFQFAQIIVTKDGFGLAARSSVHCETTGSLNAELTEEHRDQIERKPLGDKITLIADDVPVEGRIVNTEGQPVAGALVEVTAISEGNNGSLDEWFASAKKPDADYWSLNRYRSTFIGGGSRVRAKREDTALATKTDESGRFVLRGLGRERMATVFVSGERIETATFHVCSRPGETVTLPWSANSPGNGRATFYSNQFTHVVGPSQAVEGRVTDKKTGQPLAGLLVKAERVAGNSFGGSLEAGYIRTVTDADGRYRLTGLPLGNNSLLVLPVEKSRYLAAEVSVATKLDEQPLARNVELAQGIMVHGHVTDSRTGKPVSGYVKYFAFNNNPHVRENPEFASAHIDFYHQSKDDSEYTIPVLPGGGILTFNANRGEHYPRGVGADEIDGPKSVTNAIFFLTSPFLVSANNFNLLKGLNLKPETEEHKLDLVLASGSTFKVKLNAADGQPLSNYYVFGQYNWAGWYEGPKDQTLSVYAYLPDEGRRVMVYRPDRNLVGLADITGEAPAQQEITLRPGGTIRGRVIDSDLSPLEGLALYPKVRDFYGKNENSPAALKDRGEFPNQLDGQQILTDKDGRFELRGLIPGLKYTVGATGYDTMNGRRYSVDRGLLFTDETIEAGQSKDLGDLRVKPIIADQKQPQAAETKAAQPTDVAASKADQPFTFAGAVTDNRGQPVAGANISFGYLHEDAAGTGPRLLATTDQEGKFQFTKTRRELTGSDGEAGLADAELIATKAGYGFAVSAVQYFESSGSLLAELGEQDKTTIEYNHGKPSSLLTLVPDDVPIRGRLLDSEGRAVAGARVEVATISRGKNGDLNDWEAAARQPGADEAATGQFVRPLSFSGYVMTGDYPLAASHLLVVPPVRTDADGRFVLSGVGRDRLVQLYISAPGIATMRIDARSRPGAVLRLPNRVSYPEFGDLTYYPADFTCVASPSVVVTGRVTDRGTGQPVAGCVIRGNKISTSPIHGGLEAMYIHTKTDADGHYRLEGLPLGDSIVQIVPPPASSYLIANIDVKTSASSTPQVRDVALSSGVKVRGRVTDARTGKRLSGRLAYFAFVTNPHLPAATGFDSPEFHYRSGADGRYEIPVLPGKGILAFMADNHHDYRRGVGADRIDGPKYDRPNDLLFRTEPSLCHPFNHHLLVSLDPAPDAKSLDLDLSLTSGLSFTGRVRRADGQPIGEYYLYGEQAFANWHNRRSAETFEVKGYFPDEGRRLMVYQPEQNLVGWVDVTGAPPNNLEIVLRQGGVLTGRVVDADGLPLEGISLDPDWGNLIIASRYSPAVAKNWGEPVTNLEGRQLLTDKEGRFELKGIIPGLQYSARAGGTTRQFGRMQAMVLGTLFTDIAAESGQTKDLGDLRIKQERSKATSPQREQGKSTSKAADHAEPSLALRASVTGTILLPTGQPAGGALVSAIARRSTPARGGDLRYDGEVLGEATTDEKGEYSLQLAGVSSQTHRYASLIARAGDSAVAWKKLDLDAHDAEASFKLVTDEPIRGRLIDIEGRAAADVKFNVRSVVKVVTGGWSDDGTGYHGEKTPAAWLPPVTCDKDGRFALRGVPPGHGVHIEIEATELFAPQGISINTGMPESRGERDGTYRPLVRNGKPGEEIVLPLTPAQIFEGTVRYEDTKQPAGHAQLNIWASQQRLPGSMISVEGKADAQGHYRIHALPGIRFGVTAYPPVGTPYLTRQTAEPIIWETSERVKQVDLTLPRGVLVRGKIVAAGSGAPIAGASIQYHPQESKDRRPDRTILTGWQNIQLSADDGSFQIPVVTGPGWLIVHAAGGSFVLKEAGSSFINYGKPGGQRYYAHAFHKIDATSGVDSLDATIELEPGAKLAGRIVDEQKNPVEEAIVISRLMISPYAMHWRGGMPPALGGRFELSGLAPGVEYPTYFYDPKHELGATVNLKAEDAEPTVVLKPCGSAVVRCVDGAGQPVPDYEDLTVHMVVTPGTHPYDYAGMQTGRLSADTDFIVNVYQTHARRREASDAAGNLMLPPLIPGATYWILTSKANDGRFEIAKEFQAKPGEKLDLGDVVVQKGSGEAKQASARPQPAKNATTTATVTGTVLLPTGQPAAGAIIRAARSLPITLGTLIGEDFKSPLSETKADAAGRFSVSFTTQPFGDLSRLDQQWREIWRKTKIAALHSGYGPAWVSFDYETDSQQPITLKLVEDMPIRGRLIDLEGRPVPNVTVKVGEPRAAEGDDLSDWIAGVKAGEIQNTLSRKVPRTIEQRLISVPTAVTTDAKGMFEIRGIGRERIVEIAVGGETVGHRAATVATRQMEPLKKSIGLPTLLGSEAVFGADFTFTAEPARVVEGIVIDAQTRQPLAGVAVESDKLAGYPFSNHRVLKTTTDKEGHFRLVGMPKGAGNRLMLLPADDQPYFMREIDVPDPVGLGTAKLEIELHRGLWITGRVTDKATGEPVPGVWLLHFPFMSNEFARSLPEISGKGERMDGEQGRYRSKADGTFRLVGLPGRAVLGALSYLKTYRRGVGYEQVDAPKQRNSDWLLTYHNGLRPSSKFPDSMKEIDPPADLQEFHVDLELDPGQSVKIRVTDAAGAPLTGVSVSGLSNLGWRAASTESVLTAANLGPQESRTLLLHHKEKNLGLALTIGPDEIRAGEVTAMLLPCATVTGQVLYEDGTGFAGLAITPWVLPSGDFSPSLPNIASDASGRFQATLLPGAEYRLAGMGGKFIHVELAKKLAIESGETKDLGTLKLDKDGKVSSMKP